MSNSINLSETNTTLPIETKDGLYLDAKKARDFGERLSGIYCFNEPYPHIVIDNFLPTELAKEILSNFPQRNLGTKTEFELNYPGIQENKRQIFPNSTNEYCRNFFSFFNSASFLQFLEGLTSIDGLIADSYFNGGGFHEIYRGGKLGIHADFRVNEKLYLARRLNVLIYLNENWNDDWGGKLEIWDKEMKNKVHAISPIFNRCVIFNTDATSHHGHPDPLDCPKEVTRKSIALYYYTASKRIYEDTPSHTTMYVSRPEETAFARRRALKLRMQNYLKDYIPPILFRGLQRLKNLGARKNC
jgi:Rps23 Pro-64 3,4-dihydroxylase Tpa1-like proline 4-hydroxylase